MPQFYTAEAVAWLKNDWKITVVRAAMAIEHEGYLSNPIREKERVKVVVDAAITEGIYVIIDWHDHNAEQHIEEAKSFFREMAQEYGSHPNVLFEVFNEPVWQDWSSVIKPYHEQLVSVIREHTDNLIILGTRIWSQDVEEAAKNPVLGINLAYTIHFYASTHRQSLRDAAARALALNVPLFATEWGTCSASGDGQLDLEETQRWLDFFERNHISDANWAIGDKQEACAALVPGTAGTGGWTADQLTNSGSWVRASIRGI
jgi:endoglucanase